MEAFRKYFVILFSFLLMFPASVDLAHAFLGHQHSSCDNYSDSHFHKKNVDCELLKFQPRPFSTPEIFSYTLVTPEVNSEVSSNVYNFLSSYQKLSFDLRGPPQAA